MSGSIRLMSVFSRKLHHLGKDILTGELRRHVLKSRRHLESLKLLYDKYMYVFVPADKLPIMSS